MTVDEGAALAAHDESGAAPRTPAPAAAEARGYAAGEPGYAQFLLAREALHDARALGQTREGLGSALLLYRAAVLLFAQARRSREPGHAQGSARSVAAPNARELLAPLPPERRSRLEPVFESGFGEAALAEQSPAQREGVLAALAELANAWGAPLEAAADLERRRHVRRWARRLAPPVLAGLALAWAASALLARDNLALHRAVSVSSAEPKVRAHPRQLVDGDRKNLAFHTQKGREQRALIDLGSVRSIRQVDVYNRFDCCQARAVPLRIDVSVDGKSYVPVARRTETFTLWSAHLPPTPARYVLLTNEADNFFHLTEVEVY